jgi:hypothetical protein
VKALKSIETAPGTFTLMAGRSVNNGFLLSRNLTTFTDDNAQTYSAFTTIGSIRLSQPGEPLVPIGSICYERMPVGTDFTVSVLLNDISGTFVPLPQQVVEPTELSSIPSTGVIAWRLYLSGAAAPLPSVVRHLQMKVAMAQEAAKNELLGIAIAPPPQ